MSQADELLATLANEAPSTFAATDTEPHIVINPDRTVTMPEELKTIAVQFDHNVNTVHFDCPRYWDGHDMSQMNVYINFIRSDNVTGSYKATVTSADETMMYFDWTIQKETTQAHGEIAFLVCVKKLEEDGVTEVRHWNSELCRDVYVSEGLEAEQIILEENPEIITQILERLDSGGGGGSYELTDQDKAEIAALASTPDQYALIESITTTEEVGVINRTEEPDGVAYALKQVLVNFHIPVAPTAGSIYIRVNQQDNTNVGFIDAGVSNTAVRYARFMADVSQGLLFTSQTMAAGASSNPYFTNFVPSWGKTIDVIDQLRLALSGGAVFPVGTKIDIYGVRSNPAGSVDALADEIISKQEQYIGGDN